MLPFLTKNYFLDKLEEMKKHIPFITGIASLNVYLKKQFQYSFQIDHAYLNMDKEHIHREIIVFFEQDVSRTVFLNDIVFLEENKSKIPNLYKQNTLDSRVYAIFPICASGNKLIGVFEL